MEIRGVHHIALKARDPARVASFYTVVLGLPELSRHEEEGELRSVWISAGETILMVERSRDGGPAPAGFHADPPGLHLLALSIDPLQREDWRAQVEAAGHPVVSETLYTLYVLDPEGNRVGLSSWPHASAET